MLAANIMKWTRVHRFFQTKEQEIRGEKRLKDFKLLFKSA